jgi:RNA polymerase sigma factor (sigma-70 family)
MARHAVPVIADATFDDDHDDPTTTEEAPAAKNKGGRGKTSAVVPLTPAQEVSMRTWLPLVPQCAKEVAAPRLDLVDPRELYATGTIALREAVVCYRPDLHPSFPQYAKHHVRGRMRDAIREEHFSTRARVERAMGRGFEPLGSHQAEPDPFAVAAETPLDAANQAGQDALAAAMVARLEAARAGEEGAVVVRIALHQAIAKLPRCERAVLELYVQGMSLDEGVAELHIHASTAKRRHKSALARLRAMLEG